MNASGTAEVEHYLASPPESGRDKNRRPLGKTTRIHFSMRFLHVVHGTRAPARRPAAGSDRHAASDLRAEAESYFDGNNLSYKNFCKSPAYSDLLANMSEAEQKTSGCKDSVAAYLTYAKLSEATNVYFCADSTGTSIELAKPPTGLVCK